MKKLLSLLIICMAVFTVAFNLSGCSKEKHKSGPAVQESEEDDTLDDDAQDTE